MPEAHLQTYLTTALAAAHAASTLLVGYQERLGSLEIERKSVASDLVSEADVETEKVLLDQLLGRHPETGFIGEEATGGAATSDGGHELVWVVDPLDGTSNFLSGLPIWSVSIALCRRDADGVLHPLLGVISAPALSRTWQGVSGSGAWLNGRQVRVRPAPPGGGLNNAMLATGFPYNLDASDPYSNIPQYTRMQLRFHKLRRMGSAAIDLALVADGTYDGMWEFHLKPWDVAAGMLLVQEAGGLIVRLDGSAFHPGDVDFISAATPELLEYMRESLAA